MVAYHGVSFHNSHVAIFTSIASFLAPTEPCWVSSIVKT